MNRLLKLIFKNEIRDYKIRYSKLMEELERKNELRMEIIEAESKKSYEQYTLIKRIFKIDKGSKIVGMRRNKNNEELIITEWVTNSQVWVKLYGRSYLGIMQLPRIMGSLKKTYSDLEESKYIIIDDINNIDDNIGNGSIMMEYFIKLAKSLGVAYISGELSSMDKDHFDRLEHFYKNFGFIVSFNEDRTSGSIRLDLSNIRGNE